MLFCGLNATGTPSKSALVDETMLLSTLLLPTTHGWDSLQDCSVDKTMPLRKNIYPVEKICLGHLPGLLMSQVRLARQARLAKQARQAEQAKQAKQARQARQARQA